MHDTVCPFKVYKSVVLVYFSELCRCYHNQFEDIFIHSVKTPAPSDPLSLPSPKQPQFTFFFYGFPCSGHSIKMESYIARGLLCLATFT